MVDLPDYYTQTAISEAEAAGIKGGLDANKSATPVSRDVYLATDTHILYVCFTDGAWTGFDAAMLTQGTVTLYEDLVAGGKKITGLADPAAAQDAATQAYVLARCGLYLPLAGGVMTGDISLGANFLRTTDLLLKQLDANTFALKDSTDTLYKDIWLAKFIAFESFYFGASGYGINAANADGAFATLMARDTGNTLIEIARLMGAADPYFQASLPMRFLPGVEPGAVVEGMLWYLAATDKMQYRNATGTKTLGHVDGKLGTFTNDVANGNQVVVGVGFSPDFLLVWATGSGYSIAVFDGTRGLGLSAPTAVPVFSTTLHMNPYGGVGNLINGELVSLDADGFTITWSNLTGVAPAQTFAYLALSMG